MCECDKGEVVYTMTLLTVCDQRYFLVILVAE